jgi:hypothetical protein
VRNQARGFVPFIATTLVALLWLNQGATRPQFLALERRMLVQHSASIGELLRAPLWFFYEHSGDEELYFATANVIRGLPRDDEPLRELRGDVPEMFHRMPPADGRWHVPYREVAFEYPALALPFILAPSFVAHDLLSYERAFDALMGVCLLLSFWLCIRARGVSDDREKRREWWIACLLLLAQGGLAIQRLDATLTLALAIALWAASRRNMLALGASLGLASAAKLTPILFVPPVLMVLRDDLRDWKAAGALAASFAGGLAAGFLPMLAMSRESIAFVLDYHMRRGLQTESALATLIGAGRLLTGTVVPAAHAFGSFNLTGDAPDTLAKLCLPLMLLGSGALTLAAGHRAGNDRVSPVALVLVASLASVWLTGKVFSPQYLSWGLPLLLAARPDTRRPILNMYLATLVVTQIYYRLYLDAVFDQRLLGIATLLLRQSLIIVMALRSVRALQLSGEPGPDGRRDWRKRWLRAAR